MTNKSSGFDSGLYSGLTPEASPRDSGFPVPPERGQETGILRPFRFPLPDSAFRFDDSRGASEHVEPASPDPSRDPATVAEVAVLAQHRRHMEALRNAYREPTFDELRNVAYLGEFRGQVAPPKPDPDAGKARLLMWLLLAAFAAGMGWAVRS